jgi:hypothetical protein
VCGVTVLIGVKFINNMYYYYIRRINKFTFKSRALHFTALSLHQMRGHVTGLCPCPIYS